VLTEHAVPPFHSEQLESVGIVPRDAAIIVVKGAVAWRAAYGRMAGEVIEVDTPGICPLDPSALERTRRR
jgi:microcystin degradation protein MlrC